MAEENEAGPHPIMCECCGKREAVVKILATALQVCAICLPKKL